MLALQTHWAFVHSFSVLRIGCSVLYCCLCSIYVAFCILILSSIYASCRLCASSTPYFRACWLCCWCATTQSFLFLIQIVLNTSSHTGVTSYLSERDAMWDIALHGAWDCWVTPCTSVMPKWKCQPSFGVLTYCWSKCVQRPCVVWCIQIHNAGGLQLSRCFAVHWDRAGLRTAFALGNLLLVMNTVPGQKFLCSLQHFILCFEVGPGCWMMVSAVSELARIGSWMWP